MPLNWNVETHAVLASTQDRVKEMAASGASEGSAVQALAQTSGRGRHGRKWESERGNFFLSFLLRPAMEARHAGRIGIAVGAALAETISGYLKDPRDLTLKWPNDALLAGKKCAGILVETEVSENSLTWAAVGVGVNIAAAPPDIGAYIERFSADPAIDLTAFREAFLRNMGVYYEELRGEGFVFIKEKWLKYAHSQGSPARVRLGERIEEGFFEGLDEDGSMLLRVKEMKVIKIPAGEVYF